MRKFVTEFLARHNKIQNKLFFPFVGVMLLVGALIVYMVAGLVLANVENRIDDKLESDAHLIQEVISDMEESLAFYAQFMADTQALAGHITEARDSRLVIIYLLDFLRENQISSNLGGPEHPTGGDDAGLGRLGMLGIRSTGLRVHMEGEKTRLALSAVAPIEAYTSGRSVVTVSREMDQGFLQELAQKIGAHEIQLYYEGRLVESSSSDRQCGEKAQEFLTPERFDQLLSGDTPFTVEFSCGHHTLKMMLVPLVVNFEKELLVGILESTDDIVKARTDTILTALAVVGVMFLIIVPMYILTVSFTVAPIRELSRASKAVAEGRLDQYVNVRTGDEVGELSASFNRMVNDLKKYREDIERWNQTLEQRVAVRTRELAEAQAQLIQSSKLAAVGELAAGIAHELNNPLAGIYAFLQVFARTLRSKNLTELTEEEAEGFQENLVHVEREIQRCKSIIGGLLTFARVSEKEYGLVDLNRVLSNALSLMQTSLRNNNVVVETIFHKDLPPVMGDANELQQVFVNVIANARKAMPDGGKLIIATSTRAAENMTCVSIADTGVGIEPDNIDKIFDPFYTTSSPGEGTGLGLSISYGIISDHNGRILCDSELGEGTTFTIMLPIADTDIPGETSASGASSSERDAES